jgi:polyphosphate kinase
MENSSASGIEIKKYFNRDLRWLSFNVRALKESLDPQLPLVEKLNSLLFVHPIWMNFTELGWLI